MTHLFYYETDLGTIGIAENGSAVTGLYFGRERPPAGASAEETELLRNAARQLREYLAGKRRIFELPLAPEGTPFQRSVWDGLLAIPYGETRSYGEIARSVGNPRACRAVGMANNRNPIPVFIPCHRVVGSDGSLVGYGGGLDIKERLLRLEGIPVGGGRIGKGGAQC
jgi:methylated-DNA-[protein]-cysteine S-methyltransferase